MQATLALELPTSASASDLATIRFEPAIEPDDRVPAMERWLELARQEHTTLRLGVELLRFDDAELKRRAASNTEPLCDLLEAVHRATERYRAAASTLDCIAARLLVALTHACSGARV